MGHGASSWQPASLRCLAPTNRPLAVAMQQAALLCSVQQQQRLRQSLLVGLPGAVPPLLPAFLSLIPLQSPPCPCFLQSKFTK